jgi:hypothetical protein
MNDIYIFHIYILIIHYIMQLYNIRVWLASPAALAREPPSSRAEPGSSAREMAEPSQAWSATELHRAEPARLGSFPALPICSHGCLDGFGILHSKHLEYILNVLSLDEGALLELLYLKSKEILQLPHYRHLRFLYHNPTKFFTR